MLAHLRRITAPPVFVGDEDQTRLAGLLNTVLLTYALALLALMVGALINPLPWPLLPATLAAIVSNFISILGLQALMRRGRTSLAGLLLALIMSAAITFVLAEAGSIRVPAAALYVVALVVAGLISGPRAMLAVLSLNSLSVLGLIVAERAGALPAPDRTVGSTQWITFTVTFGVTATLIYLAQRALNQALARTRQELAVRRQAEAALQTLSGQLVAVHEEERGHLARELHDEVGQALTALKLMLQVLPRLEPEAAQLKLREAVQVVTELTERTHDISLDLRPAMLDDFGLVSALLWLFERYELRTGIRVNPEFVRLEARLPTPVETTSYRIVQEALTNVARHAGVNEVTVRLLCDQGAVRIQVQDAGPGFNVAAALAGGQRAGLAGMHERAALLGGWVKVESAPGTGTQVLGLVPLDAAPAAGP